MGNTSDAQIPDSSLLSDDEFEEIVFDEIVSDDYEEEGNGNGLSCWEFVNPSDADPDKDSDLGSPQSSFGSWHSSSLSASSLSLPLTPQIDPILEIHVETGHVDHVLLEEYHDPLTGLRGSRFDENMEDEDENEDEDDGLRLDDELVPWDVSGKLGRQRMRKLGKRTFSKMNHSKRLPYLSLKPGCIHGKHGLGLKV